jgi:uracil-DNA glycosylase
MPRVVARKGDAWESLNRKIISCQLCPRLREHCLKTAAQKRAAFRTEDYWGKPVPTMGSASARLLIVGLAPAAHGGNRTGRVFTGDRSGDFLFAALHECGFANQPTSLHRDDGLELIDAAITAVGHCAPPDNKLLPQEIANCLSYLAQTFDLMPQLRGVVALGKVAFHASVRQFRRRGWLAAGRRPEFGHGKCYQIAGAPFLMACFHPSQQNTFTGKLTPPMMRQVFADAARLVSRPVDTNPQV